ncbi:uncharacterized protein LOC131946095 [Physella acuta]|uniref:uncharacterized protein LOC131946095 n=1 Tax=Physella acuta TaxID=109671 RepID=UPI0027DCEB49|nr:uncharacterized protein LOC131946095 [Physella acuta]
MRPRIQLRFVGEQMKYLEEQMQLMEPVIGLMKNALEKSKTWMEDKNDNPSITYIELCQELASATTALLDVASNILSENKEPGGVDGRTPSISQSTLQPTATETRDQNKSAQQVTKLSQQTAEKLSLDVKEYENKLLKINMGMQANTDVRDVIKEEIKNHSDMIASLQDENNKIFVKTSTQLEKLQSKHSVVYKLLQQRLMPIEKLI